MDIKVISSESSINGSLEKLERTLGLMLLFESRPFDTHLTRYRVCDGGGGGGDGVTCGTNERGASTLPPRLPEHPDLYAEEGFGAQATLN